MKFPYTCIFIICLLCAFSATAQVCSLTISGKVMDDNGSLPGATIAIKGTTQVTATDADGNFRLVGICQGSVTLQISYIGFQTKEYRLNLRRDEQLSIQLQADAKQLGEVVLRVSRVGNTPVQSISVLEMQDLEKTRGQSLGEALKIIPGLNSIQTGPTISKPVIHGLHSNRIVIYNAGVRQEGQQWGSEHAPEIDPFIANRIIVVKGAASVMYGADALGGVILVEPEHLHYGDGTTGNLYMLGLTNGRQGIVSGNLEGSPFKNFRMRFQGTLREAGNARTPNYFLANTGIKEANAALIMGYQKERFKTEFYGSVFTSKIGIFQGSHIGNLTELRQVFERGEPFLQPGFTYAIERPNQDVTHFILKSESHYVFDGLGKLCLQYAWQQNKRSEFDLHKPFNDSLAALNKPQLAFDLTTQTLDILLEHNPIGRINGKIGVNGIFQQNFYDGRFLIPFFDSYAAGAYIIERLNTQKWDFEVGLRADYKYMVTTLRENNQIINPDFNFSSVSGTLGATHRLNEKTSLQATVARAWRAPSINELFTDGVHHGSASYEKGDRNLKEEQAFNFTTGINYQSERFSVDAGMYLNFIDDYIYLKPLPDPVLSLRGAFPAFEYTQVDARFFGGDFTSKIKLIGNLDLISKFSFVRAKNTETNIFLELIPADKLSNTLSLELRDTKTFTNTSLEFTGTWVGKQNLVNEASDFVPPPAAYALFNVDINSTVQLGKQSVLFGFSVQNLFNTRYRDYLNRFRYFADDTGINAAFKLQIPFGKSNN